MKPKVVYLDSENKNEIDLYPKNSFRKITVYRCTHANCNHFDTNNNNWRGLISHMAMHTRVRNRHMKSIQRRSDFNCPYCKRIFRTLEKLLRHVEGKKCRENNSDKNNKEKFKEILNENWWSLRCGAGSQPRIPHTEFSGRFVVTLSSPWGCISFLLYQLSFVEVSIQKNLREGTSTLWVSPLSGPRQWTYNDPKKLKDE